MCNLQKNHWEGSRSITENMIQENRPALPPFAVLTVPKGRREQAPLALQWAGGHGDRLTRPVLAPWCTGFQCAVRKVCKSSWWHLSFGQEQLKTPEKPRLLCAQLCSQFHQWALTVMKSCFPNGDPSEYIKPPHSVTLTHSNPPHHAKDSAWHCIHNPTEVVVDPA